MSDIKFLDNDMIRSIASEDFNFVLDKQSGVSICWGKNESEDPIYDPISPEEITFEINNYTNKFDIYNQFNLLTDVRYKVNNQIVNVPIFTKDNFQELYNNPTLFTASTITIVRFSLSQNLTNLNIIQQFSKYFKKFNVKFFLEINYFHQFNNDEIKSLKFITSNIILNHYSVLNYKKLSDNNFNLDIKYFINELTYSKFLTDIKQFKPNTKGIIYFIEPYLQISKVRELEGRIKNLNLQFYFHACKLINITKNNKPVKNYTTQILNCDATTFSIFVKQNKLYSCQFNNVPFAEFTSKNDIWYNKNICEFRQKIIENGYCD